MESIERCDVKKRNGESLDELSNWIEQERSV